MRAWYFSENAYPYLPDPATFPSIRVSLPNGVYDPKIGAELYHRYLDEWQTAEDEGLDLMLNEHHQTATNLNAPNWISIATNTGPTNLTITISNLTQQFFRLSY